MGWRRVAAVTVILSLGWLTAETSSSPPWVIVLTDLGSMAAFAAAIMYSYDPDWSRKYPRLHKRMMLGGAGLTLIFALLFLLFGESSIESVLGRSSRPVLFLLYLLLFAGTVLFVRRLVAGKWNRL